jgi:cyanophycin synthetase
MNVTDPIFRAAQAHPDRLALVRPHTAGITYATLAARIDSCARHARRLGLQPGDIVGLRITWPEDDGLGLTVALGLARAGIASADVALPGQYLTAFLTRPGLPTPPGIRQIKLDAAWPEDPSTDPVTAVDDPDALLRIVGTSGTTGLPRFCPITHGLMATRVGLTGYPVAAGDWQPTVLCCLPTDGGYALRSALAALSEGETWVVGDSWQRNPVEAVATCGITSIIASPAHLAHIVEQIPPELGILPSLRAVMVAGAHMPEPLWQLVRARLCPTVVVAYGASETSGIAAALYEESEGDGRTVVRLKPGIEAEAVSEDGYPLPPGTEGLLRIRWPGNAPGYFDNPAATAEVFRDGWFHSGDIGSVSADRVMRVAGRAGDFINSGGVKINPRLIEQVLRDFPNIVDAAAFPLRDRHGLDQPWAAIVTTGPVDAAALNAHCWRALGSATPRSFLQVPQLPRNQNGKVINQALIEMAQRTLAAS